MEGKTSGTKSWLSMTAISMLVLAITACAPETAPEPKPEPGIIPSSVVQEIKIPELSDALQRNYQRNRPAGGFENVGLAIGETAVDFTLKDIHGTTYRLAELLSVKPVVMVFGSFT